MLAQLKYSSY